MDKTVWARVRALFLTVLIISLATLAAAPLLGANWVVWLRGGAVAAAAAWLLALTAQAAAGKRSAYLRIRLITTIAPIGIALIVAVPDNGYPPWMKAEQALVGLLLAAVAIIVNRPRVRQAYPRRGKLG
ncbi:hypothetical protein MTP10_39680 [Nonomuraea sp. 3-1Str]|uniref:hypothetical protein n=1 Tax=Nonomuraea sp. 3-1Str TaxID=2929801 RepID=UPI002864892E|nr:hypothetical protein [Nonomuraea sp. 3-1Str]MDR8414837.1 hypothetical protein [Nonomuraea sp. 3-1Str]